MLNTTLLQLQQVELQISRLRDYMREHELQEVQPKTRLGYEEGNDDTLWLHVVAIKASKVEALVSRTCEEVVDI